MSSACLYTLRLFLTSAGWQENREGLVSRGEHRKDELDVCWVDHRVCAGTHIAII